MNSEMTYRYAFKHFQFLLDLDGLEREKMTAGRRVEKQPKQIPSQINRDLNRDSKEKSEK